MKSHTEIDITYCTFFATGFTIFTKIFKNQNAVQ